mmetsp:Transcript_101909/g.292430  ORF Transcript_101909/g.292430 Transcript_101909/m.292430 type:complete len:237 (+) Transcript_101909:164-874(+)
MGSVGASKLWQLELERGSSSAKLPERTRRIGVPPPGDASPNELSNEGAAAILSGLWGLISSHSASPESRDREPVVATRDFALRWIMSPRDAKVSTDMAQASAHHQWLATPVMPFFTTVSPWYFSMIMPKKVGSPLLFRKSSRPARGTCFTNRLLSSHSITPWSCNIAEWDPSCRISSGTTLPNLSSLGSTTIHTSSSWFESAAGVVVMGAKTNLARRLQHQHGPQGPPLPALYWNS